MRQTSIKSFVLPLLFLAAIALPPRIAWARDSLEKRIDRLEKELSELKELLKAQAQAGAKAAPPSAGGAAAVAARPETGSASGSKPTAAAMRPTTEEASAAPPVAATPGAGPVAGGPAVPLGPAPAPAAAGAQPPAGAAVASSGASAGTVLREVAERVKLGGYGSTRFEASSLPELKDTFTLRRLVLTVDGNVAPRLRSYVEVEFERFRKLELEQTLQPSNGGLAAEVGVEGTNHSEISLEQAWLEFDAQSELHFRVGAVLVPLGRFNINHDDNRWDMPRRPLLDRGVPVIPVAAAWDELGAGLNGEFELGRSGLLNYQLYVMNGATLDPEIETIAQSRQGDTTLSEIEVSVSPDNGTFDRDVKDAKSLSGRLAWSPSLGDEIAGSFYWGRYTPDFLPNEQIYSLALDGATNIGPIEVQGEFVFTHFGGIQSVAQGFARKAFNSESNIENATTEVEVDFELANLASNKYGYWLYFRYPFFPSFMRDTVLGRPFENPQFALFFLPEQVWFNGLVNDIKFENSELTSFSSESRLLNRFTAGLSYRPTPLVVFSLAYEYTRTNSGKSLSSVTNYLPAGPTENEANTFMAGAAFGF